jgi:hypothetical protein
MNDMYTGQWNPPTWLSNYDWTVANEISLTAVDHEIFIYPYSKMVMVSVPMHNIPPKEQLNHIKHIKQKVSKIFDAKDIDYKWGGNHLKTNLYEKIVKDLGKYHVFLNDEKYRMWLFRTWKFKVTPESYLTANNLMEHTASQIQNARILGATQLLLKNKIKSPYWCKFLHVESGLAKIRFKIKDPLSKFDLLVEIPLYNDLWDICFTNRDDTVDIKIYKTNGDDSKTYDFTNILKLIKQELHIVEDFYAVETHNRNYSGHQAYIRAQSSDLFEILMDKLGPLKVIFSMPISDELYSVLKDSAKTS